MSICEICKAEHSGTYGSGRFCGFKCSKSSTIIKNREQTNIKRSMTLKSHFKYYTKQCPVCYKQFIVTECKLRRVCCCRSCAAIFQNQKNPGQLKMIAKLGGLKSVTSQQRRSKNEIYFAQLCQQKFNTVVCNEPMFDGWDADIIIPSHRVAVLWNGIWHYKKVTKRHSLEQVQCRDNIKLDKISNCGYTAYVIKDMGKYNQLFVENEFKKFVNHLYITSQQKP